MFLITLAEKGGGEQQLEFNKTEVTIGRLAGNDIVLAKGNVSKFHSRIVLKDGKSILVDMKSTNGTYVNGKKIAAPQVIRPTDKIYIGDYIINVEAGQRGSQTRNAPRTDEGNAPSEMNGEPLPEGEEEPGAESEGADPAPPPVEEPSGPPVMTRAASPTRMP